MSHESGDWEQICGGISSHLLKQVIQDLKRERLLYEGSRLEGAPPREGRGSTESEEDRSVT